MEITSIVKLVIALGLINVWAFRYNKSTSYRGGDAGNMKEEFTHYGLPDWFMYVIGAFKVGLACLLLLTVFVFENQQIEDIGLSLLSLVMLGAILMHIKVKDPLLKSLPAFLMLIMSGSIALGLI
tara:strand:- start:8 stop:382 length:375 start_codon:yes stop_codon:yes gene_type:complete